MNLARSRTRTGPRSPAPPPPTHERDQNRPFLPPSHYAAAAGIASPRIDGADAGERRRMSTAPAVGRGKADDRRSRLDFMESQLLPTLNDTIGRMTQASPDPFARSHTENAPAVPATPLKSSFARRGEANPPTPRSPAITMTPSPVLPPQKSVRRVKSTILPKVPKNENGRGNQSDTGQDSNVHRAQHLATPVSNKRDMRPRSVSSAASPRTPTVPSQPVPSTLETITRSKIARRQASQPALDSPAARARGDRAFMLKRTASEDDSSASELEPARPKPRLFVANASTPSASEIEADVKPSSRLPTPAARRQTQYAPIPPRRLGLGIEVAEQTAPTALDDRVERRRLAAGTVHSESSTTTLVSDREEPTEVATPLVPNLRPPAASTPLSIRDMLRNRRQAADIPTRRSVDSPTVDRAPRTPRNLMIESMAANSSPRTPRTPSVPPANAYDSPMIAEDLRERISTPQMNSATNTPKTQSARDRSLRRESSGWHLRRDAEPAYLGGPPDEESTQHLPSLSPCRPPHERMVFSPASQSSSYRDEGSIQTAMPSKEPSPPSPTLNSYHVRDSPPQTPITPSVAPSKSPGRQAIKRHSFVNLPSSLRRYSVYGSSPTIPPTTPSGGTAPSDVIPTDLRSPPAAEPGENELHPVDSDLSVYSSASDRWSQPGDDLSCGAQALFQSLGGAFMACAHDSASTSDPTRGPSSVPSAASSMSSFYADEAEPQGLEPPLEAAVGPLNTRADAIHAVRETQQACLAHIQTALEVFVAPLRADGAGAWLPGVPAELGRLFAWFEDIVVLHSHIRDVLQEAPAERVGHVLRECVPRFEVYQPYLVRAPGLLVLLRELLADGGNDLVEYIRIQEEQEECRGLGLLDFFAEPLNHMERCVGTFKALLAATPRDHPDFMATFSLVHSADMVFRIMEEVKAREDEYDAVKAIAEQIAGLQQAEKLARRERRLLHQGQLAQTEGAPLYLFVFTDVLLATTADEDEDHRWMLNERAGVCRLLEVLEPSLDTFLCYVSPMTLEDVEDGIISPVSSVVELALHVPAGPLRSAWAAALRACALHTVRSLSFPTHSGRYLAHGPSVDLAADTASSVRALLAAGLPLPKSPSIQIDDAVRGRRAPEHAAEREERGWWALRFQQVLREMQRRPGEL